MLRFDPFSDLDALTRGLLTSQTGSNRTPRFMPMDLCKIDDHYLLTADLPGVDPGSVDVDVDNGTLTISAHRTARSDESAYSTREASRSNRTASSFEMFMCRRRPCECADASESARAAVAGSR